MRPHSRPIASFGRHADGAARPPGAGLVCGLAGAVRRNWRHPAGLALLTLALAGCTGPRPDASGRFFSFPDANAYATRLCQAPIEAAGGPNIRTPTGTAGSSVTAQAQDGFRRITVQPLELTFEGFEPVPLYCHVDARAGQAVVSRSPDFPVDAFPAAPVR